MRFVALALILTGMIALVQPASAEQEQLQLQVLSDQGTFRVEINWTTNDIGKENIFEIRFIEPETGTEIEDVKYDMIIFKGEQQIEDRKDQKTLQQEYAFDEANSYTIKIDDIEDLGEGASFTVEVTPEFPSGILALAAAAIGASIFATKLGNNKFSC